MVFEAFPSIRAMTSVSAAAYWWLSLMEPTNDDCWSSGSYDFVRDLLNTLWNLA
jgi:hypothetical protein